MHLFFHIGHITIPVYGTMITLGIFVANIVAVFLLKKRELDINNFILVEAYCGLGGFLGAKGLYLLVSANKIDWSRMLDASYINQIMQGGFVFYGGFIGGLGFALLSGKIHKFNAGNYIEELIFLVPLVHGFGRIGCFFAGCCYGIPYHGVGAVIFPDYSYALPNVELFPVQIVEAISLFALFVYLLILQEIKHSKYVLEHYVFLYALIRFVLEFFRYDEERGKVLAISTSQWISMFMIVIASFLIRRKHLLYKNLL